MSSALQELIQVGHDINSIKYYSVALGTLLLYDYFLTLQDELEYAWKGNKSWAFAIYFLNRYLPMVYTIWIVMSNFSWAYTYEMCTKSAFIEILFFVWCTLIAQIILNVRLYAITMKNVIITGFFVCITILQFALGIYLTNLAANAPAQRPPPIHLTAYQLCVFARHRKVEVAYTAMSLIYDFLAFLVIVVLAIRPAMRGFKMPQILRTIVQDSTVYFLVIFTSHFVLEMTLLLARPNLQLLPAIGNVVYLPIMIGRLMLSLKKGTRNPDVAWPLTSVAHPSGNRWRHASKPLPTMRFNQNSQEDTVLQIDDDVTSTVVSSTIHTRVSGSERIVAA